jgi:WD40 repeat protein
MSSATAVPAIATEQPTSTTQATPEPPVATPTAIPTILPSPTAIAPADLQVISPENAEQLSQLAQFGSGRIDSLTWTPDGTTLVVGSSQGVDFYDSQTLQLVQTIRDEQISGSIHIRLSPSGKFMIMTMGGGEMDWVTLWDAGSGRYIRDLVDAFFADFSSDDSLVYFEWGSQQLVWQDPSSGQNSRTLPLPYAPRAFNLASQTIVELYEETSLRLHDMASGEVRHTLELPHGLAQIVFSPSGNLLAVSSYDGFVRLWQVQSGALLYKWEGQEGWDVRSFSPDGRYLVTYWGDKTIHVWDTSSGQLVIEVFLQPGCGRFGTVAFSPDSGELAVVNGGTIQFYDMAAAAWQRTLDNGYCFASDLAFSADNNTLLVAGGDNVQTLALPGGQLLQTAKTDSPVTSLAASRDGQRMVWGGGDNMFWLQLWDLVANQPLYTVTEGGGAVHKVAFSPDDQLLAVQSGPWEAPLVELRTTDSGELVASYPANTFAFTPDGRFLATATTPYTPETGGIALWDTTNFQLVRTFDQLELLTISPNGNLLAGESDAGIITSWWNIESGERLHPLSPPEELIAVPALSPDGRLLLATVYYSNLVMLDSANGQVVWGRTHGQSGEFSQDGRYLATVSTDGMVRLWGLPPATR